MYKGLAIISVPGAGQGRGGGGARPWPGSKHDLGLAWAHPSSRGGGGRESGRGCIHNTHLAHNIIKILISTLKHKRGCCIPSSPGCLSPTRDVSWPQPSIWPGPAPHHRMSGRHQGPSGKLRNWESVWSVAWEASGLSCCNQHAPRQIPPPYLSLSSHI